MLTVMYYPRTKKVQEKSTNSLPEPFWNSKKAENSMNSLTTEQNESLKLNLKPSKLKRV